MRVPYRGARASGLCFFFPSFMRGGAPKSANLWCPSLSPETAGAFRRANKRSSICAQVGQRPVAQHESTCSFAASLIGTGPRFRLVLPRSSGARGQVVSQLLTGTRRVVPGGAPMRPECLTANQARGRRTPSRRHERLAKRPFNGRGARTIRAFRMAGISSVPFARAAASRRTSNRAPQVKKGLIGWPGQARP